VKQFFSALSTLELSFYLFHISFLDAHMCTVGLGDLYLFFSVIIFRFLFWFWLLVTSMPIRSGTNVGGKKRSGGARWASFQTVITLRSVAKQLFEGIDRQQSMGI